MSKAGYSYEERLRALHNRKLREAEEKRRLFGSMDYDEWGNVLPPKECSRVVETLSASGIMTRDIVFSHVDMESSHPNGDFYGAGPVGRNYRTILENHPVFIDPMSSLAGAYMTNFYAYRKTQWNPAYDFSHLRQEQELYGIVHGIGGQQHLCQDNELALTLGLPDLLERVRNYRKVNPDKGEFYNALEDILLGLSNWIERTASNAEELASGEQDGAIQKNLWEIAQINRALLKRPPETFREACQLVLWMQLLLRMYNGSGSIGRLDLQLDPFYKRDAENGRLSDEEAIFHIACLLLRDTGYIQLGGYARDGSDDTNRLSYLVLEAGHRLDIPANVAVAVADDIDEGLLRRGVEILLEDKTGYPKFLGMKPMTEGFARNGCPMEDARQRVYAGCHWHAIPGREYSHMDLVKINLPKVFEVALRDMLADPTSASAESLWERFTDHLKRGVDCIKSGCELHHSHMHEVFPELAIDLLCHGPIEKGIDASHGSLDYSCYGIDAAGLATVADSFAALEQRIDRDKALTYERLSELLSDNWQGPDGEFSRRMLAATPRFGHGGTPADRYAKRISEAFSDCVNAPTEGGTLRYIPGVFGWANIIDMGKQVGATPDGRFKGEPISHGANPSRGFRADNAPTALLKAVARVQPGWGNAAPAQLDLDPSTAAGENAAELVAALIKAHFHDGGTQINLNVMDVEKLLEANRSPEKNPDLIVRVTGFSAYFASLSPEMRRFVVDRIVQG